VLLKITFAVIYSAFNLSKCKNSMHIYLNIQNQPISVKYNNPQFYSLYSHTNETSLLQSAIHECV